MSGRAAEVWDRTALTPKRCKMPEHSTQIRPEVQQFIVATEQLYKFLAGGKSLTVHEVEAVSCCMHELLAKGSGDEPTVRAFRVLGDRPFSRWK
jgi:hypothetical protein